MIQKKLNSPQAGLPAILIVDTDQFVAEAIAEHLRDKGYQVHAESSSHDALELLRQDPAAASEDDRLKGEVAAIGVLITDLNLPDMDGISLLRKVRKAHPDVVPMVLTGYGDIASAVESIKAGASDFLTKPLMDDELTIALEKAVQHHYLLQENTQLKHALNDEAGRKIIGNDPLMQKVYARMDAVSSGRSTVLIQGESGTGKSLIAKAIHEASDRRQQPFITFACGSIPESLLESELFGHVKGAFTGADIDKTGRLLSADGGTLFIDEINSATPALQLKLLRVLQERMFEPLGSTKTREVDIRFILATNEPLEPLIEEKVFREDLYYRIKVVDIQLPPLRARKDDLLLLAHHYMNHYAVEMDKMITGFTPEVRKAILNYRWPGNVRELENAMERAVVLAPSPTIELEDIPEVVAEAAGMQPEPVNGGLASAAAGGEVLWSAENPMSLSESLLGPERNILQAALDANEWNRQKTAQLLDINRTTLYKKIKQFNLSPTDPRMD